MDADEQITGAQSSDVDDAPASSGPGSDEDTFAKLKTWFKDSRDKRMSWAKDAEEDYAFVDGSGQWDEEDKAALKTQLRPVITFNRIAPVIDTVTGLETGNRQEVHYSPRQIGKAGVNDLLSETARWVRGECDAEDEESDMFIDMVTCGMGWTETRPDYEIDPDGLILIERVDPLEMYWDMNSRKRNIGDRRYHFHAKKMAADDAKSMFPDYELVDIDAAWAGDERDTHDPHNAFDARFYRNDQTGREGTVAKNVTVVYAEWWEREEYYAIFDPSNAKRIAVPKGGITKIRALNKQLETLGFPKIEATKLTRKVYKSAWLGRVMLDDPQTGKKVNPARVKVGFSLNCVTGKREKKTNTWFGIVRAMKDPQRWANKFFSQILHIINSNAKGGVMIESGAVPNIRKFEEDWARSDSVTVVNDGALSKEKIQPKQAITFPAGLDKMMDVAITAIPQTTGVNWELMGQVERDQPGILEYQRKQAGMTILATLFGSLRRYRKEQGRVLLYCIQEYLTPGRLVKIDGDDGAQYVPFVKDPDLVEYDIVVDEAAASPNQKEQTWAMVTQMMPLLKDAPVQVIAELVKYSPLPNSVSEKINQILINQKPPPDPKVQAMQQKAQLDQEQAKQQFALDQQRAQIEAANDQRDAEAKRQNDMRDAANEARDNHQEFLEAIMQERVKAGVQLQLLREKHDLEMKTLQEKADAQVAAAREMARAKASAIRKQPARTA